MLIMKVLIVTHLPLPKDSFFWMLHLLKPYQTLIQAVLLPKLESGGKKLGVL